MSNLKYQFCSVSRAATGLACRILKEFRPTTAESSDYVNPHRLQLN